MGMSFSDWLILNQCDQNSLPEKNKARTMDKQ